MMMVSAMFIHQVNAFQVCYILVYFNVQAKAGDNARNEHKIAEQANMKYCCLLLGILDDHVSAEIDLGMNECSPPGKMLQRLSC